MKKILLLSICTLYFSFISCAQKEVKKTKETSKIEAFTSKKGIIIKFLDYNLPNLKLNYGAAETKIRKFIAGGEIEYFYNISKKGKYDSKNASIAYEDLLELIKSIPELEKMTLKDLESSADYLENKFVTDDGLQLGYYISKKKINWYIVLEKYGSDNTIFIKEIETIKLAFNNAKNKIEELKK